MSFTLSEEKSFLTRLTTLVEANMSDERFGVSELARKMGMSRSNLHRKVKSLTGNSVSKFICVFKLERAKQLLQESSSTISEIAFETGFHNVSYFAKCYKDYFGHPPGEERKLESAISGEKNLQGQASEKVFSKKIPIPYLYASVSVLVALFVFVFFINTNLLKNKSLDKAIAVLPFINDSPDLSEMYFINGTMEAILNNLGKIEDLRVVSRTSVEQYRNNPKSIAEVSREMDVGFILEGSGQKQGDEVLLTVQLIDAKKDQQIWSHSYKRKFGQIFALQSEIAQLVASEVEAIITPEERELIEKALTENNTAYDLFIRAREEQKKDPSQGEELYRLALTYDSTFSSAYAFLGWIYWWHYQNQIRSPDNCLDSIRKFLDLALFYDDQLCEAYNLGGYYHRLIGETDKAQDDFHKAHELNPNHSGPVNGIAWLAWERRDLLGTITNLHKSLGLEKGSDLPVNYRSLSMVYQEAGFHSLSDKYYKKALELEEDDSALFYFSLEHSASLPEGDLIFLNRLENWYKNDSSRIEILLRLGNTYLFNGQVEKSLWFFEKYAGSFDTPDQLYNSARAHVGLSYWLNGNIEQANVYFDRQVKLMERNTQEEGRISGAHYYLAQVYAIRGDKDLSLKYLKSFSQLEGMAKSTSDISTNPFFRDMAKDVEFQQIAAILKSKYLVEHNKVLEWLKKNEMI